MRTLLLAMLFCSVPTAMSAHPDHSAGAPVDALHYLGDPFHLAIVAAAAMILAFVLRVVQRQSPAAIR